jgi:malate dehydrogenase (oxaloacetate-decarboxylating)(NADP+)
LQGSPVSQPSANPHTRCDGRTMLLKHVSTVSIITRPVPTSCTVHQLGPLWKSRSVRFQARNLNLNHVLRPRCSTILPLLLSKSHPMASFGYSSSSASSVVSTPAGTASPSPSSSISSLASMRMSPANKRVSLSGRGVNAHLGDTTALENSFRAASLDTMRGYSQNAYAVIEQTHETESIPRPRARGYQLLREPAWNKGWPSILVFITRPLAVADALYIGTSFTPEERVTQNLTGLIPHVMENMDTQCMRAMKMVRSRSTPIDKYLYLSLVKSTNTDLFYRLLIDNFEELMPLVYTPTIGDVCLQYSTLYTRPEALYISIKQRKSIRTILRNWMYPDPSICVVTDGSRILGLGDLGVNGVGISVSACSPIPKHNHDVFHDC